MPNPDDTSPRGPRDGAPEGDPGEPRRRAFPIFFVVLMLLLLFDVWSASQRGAELPYSEFRTLVAEGEVEKVVVSGQQVRGEFVTERDGQKVFTTTVVNDSVREYLDEHGVEYSGEAESVMFTLLLSSFLPLLLLVAIWLFIMRRMGRGGPGGTFMSVGKSKAKVFVEDDTKVDFGHVAGVDEAKEELKEVVDFLRNPEQYGRLGARMPKGVLLVGPPGTGKTLIARAVAGEAGVPFFSISGSEFVEMFVGVGAARVRDLFEQARKKAPCIIFIDELDALGRARSSQGAMGGHDEKEQTLNQLLVELDGFDGSSGIVILAATNRPEILDPALLRAGRFDRQVLVDRPDRNGRAAILIVHMGGVTLAPEVDADKIAALTPGFTGADLANLVNEAALVATRRDAAAVTMDDFTAAIERIVAGLEKRNRLLNEEERRFVAFHEMGHALVASALPGIDPVHKVSIIPRGIGALGYTMQRPTDDRYLMTRRELENKLAVLLGGRAAEKIVFDHLSTGASDDLSRASEIARSMVTQYAMIPELGHAAWTERSSTFLEGPLALGNRPYSDATAQRIDEAISTLVDAAYDKAIAILTDARDVLDESAEKLLEVETLDEDALEPYLVKVRPEGVSPASNGAPTPGE